MKNTGLLSSAAHAQCSLSNQNDCSRCAGALFASAGSSEWLAIAQASSRSIATPINHWTALQGLPLAPSRSSRRCVGPGREFPRPGVMFSDRSRSSSTFGHFLVRLAGLVWTPRGLTGPKYAGSGLLGVRWGDLSRWQHLGRPGGPPAACRRRGHVRFPPVPPWGRFFEKPSTQDAFSAIRLSGRVGPF